MAKLELISVAFCILSVSFLVSSFRVKDCGNGGDGRLETVQFQGCQVSESHCSLIKGTNLTLDVRFSTGKLVSQLRTKVSAGSATVTNLIVPVREFKTAHLKVFGYISIVKIPFPISPDDACAAYGLKCPSTESQDQQLSVTVPVLESYPSIKLDIQAELIDENENKIACIRFPAKIHASESDQREPEYY